MGVIAVLLAVWVVDRGVGVDGEVGRWMVLGLVGVHIVVHNRGLGAMAIVYCADVLDDLGGMIVAIKVCSFMVALTSEYMI